MNSMQLVQFGYMNSSWNLNPIKFQPVNLLVGKNAVGKSKVIKSLSNAVHYILQTADKNNDSSFVATFNFESSRENFYYQFTYMNGKVSAETLLKESEEGGLEVLLKRDSEGVFLHGESINPPEDKLVLHVRRDTVQYPYFEKIVSWAEHVCGHRFNEMEYAGDYGTYSSISKFDSNLYEIVKSLPEDAMARIIQQANDLGYPLESIVPYEYGDKFKVVFFKEQNIKDSLMYFQMSKGMFRTLYLLIYMEYLAYIKKPSMLLVDDLCEGLDYDRSTRLGRILFDFCLQHDIQLIASSNDSFLMDVVDLKYWNILRRTGSVVEGINHSTHPDLFDDFGFTGLSNFDLFSSDYIARHLTKKDDE